MQVRNGDVFQRNAVGRIEGDHCVRSNLRCSSEHRLEIGKELIVELEHVARTRTCLEVGDRILAITRPEHKRVVAEAAVIVSLSKPPEIVSATLKPTTVSSPEVLAAASGFGHGDRVL